MYAFEFASALTLGLEGLPARHRPATHRALRKAGFTGRDLWRYLRAALPVDGLPRGADHITLHESDHPRGMSVEAVERGERVAEATVGHPVAGVGVLWWIAVVPSARGRGLGLALLGRALDLLTRLGAHEAILYVDDDAPPGDAERDRTAANALYDRAGFTEVDRLHSFSR